MMAPTRRRKAAPVTEVEDTGSDAFEELEDIEAEDEAPAPKTTRRTRRKPAAEEVVEDAPAPARKRAAKKAAPAPAADEDEGPSAFNSAWLAEHVADVTGVEVDSRAVRMYLRKLAANGDLGREVGVDRGRYEFPKGANDPTVKKVIKMVQDGVSATPARKAAATEDDEVEDAPAPRRRTPAAKKAAPAKKTATPAKATPARRSRRARADAE